MSDVTMRSDATMRYSWREGLQIKVAGKWVTAHEPGAALIGAGLGGTLGPLLAPHDPVDQAQQMRLSHALEMRALQDRIAALEDENAALRAASPPAPVPPHPLTGALAHGWAGKGGLRG